MKSLAIISEFNPFHNGHNYLIKKAKERIRPDLTFSIMSGDFVQRGEACIMDKFLKAQASIHGGLDLVIEMPSFISLQSAEYFAEKSIEILGKMQVDYLAFGIENIGEKEFIKKADKLIADKEIIASEIKSYMKSGMSYAKASNKSIAKRVGEDFLMANNILGLSYLRAIDKLSLNIKACPISRKESLNKDLSVDKKNFASSTAIRNNLSDPKIESLMPKKSYELLKDFVSTYGLVSDDDIYTLLKYKILVGKSNFSNIIGYEEGFENLFRKSIDSSKTYEDFLEKLTSSRYTKSRMRRFILSYILDLKLDLNDLDYNFIKVLAFNKNAAKHFKDFRNLKLIVRKSDARNLNKDEKLIYDKMIDASNLYSLLLKRNPDYDFRHNNRAIL